MRRVITTDITTSAAAKIKKGTLDHLQNAVLETTEALGLAMFGEKTITLGANKYMISRGTDSVAGAVHTLDSGAILYGGEIYLFPGGVINLGGGNSIICDFDVTTVISSASYDPVSFTDGSTHNIHFNRKITITQGNSLSGTQFYYNTIIFPTGTTAYTAGSANYVLTAPAIGAQCIRNRDGLVKSRGVYTLQAGAATGQTIHTYPTGFRPPELFTFNVELFNAGAWKRAVMHIDAAGLLVFDNFEGAGPYTNYTLAMDSVPLFHSVL